MTQIGETYGTDTFYGNHAASSFGSIVTLEWLGQPYRLSRINLPEDAQSDLYIQLNPARKVPLLLLENGTRLSESAAILQHLAWRDPSKGLTFAQGTPEYDHLNQVLAFVNTDYWSSFAPAFKAFDMDLTGEKDPPVQKMLREFGGEAHAALEAMMGDREWLAGDRRTIADTYFAGIARSVPFLASTGAETVDSARLSETLPACAEAGSGPGHHFRPRHRRRETRDERRWLQRSCLAGRPEVTSWRVGSEAGAGRGSALTPSAEG